MKRLLIHSLMFHGRTWQRVARRLAEVGITLKLVPQTAAHKALEEAKGEIDLPASALIINLILRRGNLQRTFGG
jgi:hypothetical protein